MAPQLVKGDTVDWLSLSLLCAFFVATVDALTKRYYKEQSPFAMGRTRYLFALPWLVIALFFIPMVRPDGVFYLCLAVGLPLEALALYCYMKAIRSSPLSLCLPFFAFTPVFILLTGKVMLGETVGVGGAVGIVLIVIGSYVINLSKIETGLFSPIREIFHQQGSRLILTTAFLYSITSVIGKTAVLHSNPYFFAVVYFLALSLMMVLPGPWLGEKKGKRKPGPMLPGLLIGMMMAMMIFTHMLAISKIQVAYMIAIKRTSLLFGAAYGIFWFKEERGMLRLTGAAIMLVGAIFVGWAG